MNIYVGNLSLEVTEDELRREFVIFGKVTSVTLMNDRSIGSGQSRCCAYVEMPSLNEGDSAIEQLQGKSLKGRKMDVIKALPVTRILDNKPDDEKQVSGFSRKTRSWGVKWHRS